jgi:hypothetical protein
MEQSKKEKKRGVIKKIRSKKGGGRVKKKIEKNADHG